MFLRLDCRRMVSLLIALCCCRVRLAGIRCIDVDGVSRLAVELKTECYKGAHLYTAVFIWLALIVYVIGFPLACLWTLIKSRRSGKLFACLLFVIEPHFGASLMVHR